MNRPAIAVLLIALCAILVGCSQKTVSADAPKSAPAFGSAMVESSGGKQIGTVGSPLPQSVVVQVNDDQGNGVAGATVEFSGPVGVSFDPSSGVTDSSGQFTTNVTLGGMAGRYQISAYTVTKAQKKAEVSLEEIALGFQERMGSILSDKYCAGCHDPESTPERVSNYDNLDPKPHAFTEGDAFNKMTDADLVAIISHGGPAFNKSALMPPYGYTLCKSEIQAVLAYIRMVSDPPYRPTGIVYGKQ
jgi:mono/diheme cytochrome c family protein